MLIRLTDDGQSKYKQALKDYKLSDEEIRKRQGSGRKFKFTYEDISVELGEGWSYDKVKRFFNGELKYPVSKNEAEAICKILNIDFDLSDYEIKQGSSLIYLPALKQTGPSEKRFDELQGRKDDNVVLEDKVPDETQQPCNPAALRAEVSDGSIPDLFDSSDLHLKVRVTQTHNSSLNLRELETGGGASLSCRLLFSLYQGQHPLTKHVSLTEDNSLAKDNFLTKTRHLDICCSTDPLNFLVADPSPLIDAIGGLCQYLLAVCRSDLKNELLHLPLPPKPNLHLHLMLPLSWLSGPLPEAIRQGLKRQVFFSCSDRADRKNKLSGSAITQLHVQAIQVNQSLHSGRALSSLYWATVCDGDAQPVPLAQLFQSTPDSIHLSDSDLDSETDYCELVGRDALLAAEHRLLFAEKVSGADGGSAEGRMDQRWWRLVEIGLPLVFWWRDPGALAESARVDRLEAVLKGSWREFCNALQFLEWNFNPTEQNNLAMKDLLGNLGIFYEEPLRLPVPAPYHLPLHTAP